MMTDGNEIRISGMAVKKYSPVVAYVNVCNFSVTVVTRISLFSFHNFDVKLLVRILQSPINTYFSN